MADQRFDIEDDDFRVIRRVPSPAAQSSAAPREEEVRRGRKSSARAKRRSRRLVRLMAGAACILGFGILIGSLLKPGPDPVKQDPAGVFDKDPGTYSSNTPGSVRPVDMAVLLGFALSPAGPYVQTRDTVVNDIPLTIMVPRAGSPVLHVGKPGKATVAGAILGLQAADVRSDNGGILGSFVLEGKPLASGSSKKGFAAIIDGKVTIGSGDDTPLYEKAAAQGGYFFRQYPLVCGGSPQSNTPRNKALRRALCQEGGRTFVVLSSTRESLHDFAQALSDLGVEDAVNLVGGDEASMWMRTQDGSLQTLPADQAARTSYPNESYILWTVPAGAGGK